MSLPVSNTLPPLPESTFYMLRCVVAIARADNIVKQEELLFIRALVSHFKRHTQISPQQMAQLKEDLKFHQPIEALLPHVTDKGDREQLVLFAGLLAQADGDVHPSEEELLRRIQTWCGVPPDGATVHANAVPHDGTTPASAAPMLIAPAFDVHGFMEEVRDTVKKEVFTQAMKNSGVGKGTRHVAVIDAFAEKSPIIPHNDASEVIAEESKLSRDMRHSLVPEERLLARAKFHWIYTFYSLLGAAVLIGISGPLKQGIEKARDYVVSGNANWIGESNIPKLYALLQNPLMTQMPQYVLFCAAALFVIWRMLVQRTTEIVVTDSRLVMKEGIFWIKTFKADMTQLGQVDVEQSLLGRILGYGRIHIFTRNFSGKGNQMEAEGIYLPAIADPHGFSTQIDRARRMWRKGQV
jgi:tellurite resistance protein